MRPLLPKQHSVNINVVCQVEPVSVFSWKHTRANSHSVHNQHQSQLIKDRAKVPDSAPELEQTGLLQDIDWLHSV